MSINFAAVHDRKRWRNHQKHKTLDAATDGKDGAKSLLRRIGRVGDKWKKYGDVQCVFVWEDDAKIGHAFRLARDGSGTIQSEVITIDNLVRFRKNKGCTDQEIEECFDPGYAGSSEATAVEPPRAEDFAVDGTNFFPDELPEGGRYIEGLAQEVLVNRYERSRDARRACLARYGCICQVCDLDFSERYGTLGAGFIHVHHRVPIASIGATYRIDPVTDLVPVCPNCHAMLHRHEPPLDVEQLRAFINDG